MAVTIDGNGVVTAGGTSTSQGQIVLGEDTDNGSNTVTIQAPASLAANRTVTMPDADINFATGLSVAQGGTGLTTTTAYGLLAAGTTATGNFQQVSGTGTLGQALLSNGASALPSWGTISSTFVLLTSGTISGSPTTVDVETGFTDTGYELILIFYENIKVASSSGNPSFRFKIGGSYNSSGIYSTRNIETTASAITVASQTLQTSMVLSAIPQITTAGTSFPIIVCNRFQGATNGACYITNPWSGHQNDSMVFGFSKGYAAATSGDVQGFRLIMTGGGGATQFSSGTYYVYGIKTT